MSTALDVIIKLLLAATIGAGLGYWVGRGRWNSQIRRYVAGAVTLLVTVGVYWLLGTTEKLETTARGVVVSIVASALLFLGANKLFDLPPNRWPIYSTIVGLGSSTTVFLLLWGNRAIDDPVSRTVAAAVIGAAAGWTLGTISHRWTRLAIGVGTGATLGALAASGMRKVILLFEQQGDDFELWPVLPNIDYGLLVGLTISGAAVGYALWQVRGRRHAVERSLVAWATLGYFIAAWVLPRLGTGTKQDALIGAIGVGVGVGAAAGLRPIPDSAARDRIEVKSRAYIFLVPALTFIGATLVIPTLRTLYLSLHDVSFGGGNAEFVGLLNYGDIFTDSNIFDTRGWRDIFGSSLFIVGLGLIVLAIAVGLVLGSRRGDRFDFSVGTLGTGGIGIFLVVFAVFAALRGTIFNNLWWVFAVTIIATSAGLGVAVLADRAKYESAAKSLIFMPMAISFVGAGVIWRFMYQARDVSREQTGVLNSIWVGLGRFSTQGGATRSVLVAILVFVGIGVLVLGVRAWRVNEKTIAVGSTVTALPIFYFAWRLVTGIGGFVEQEDGTIVPDTILFVQEAPFNNVWLMLVLIWIQTGFTMVIFSAAIKAVPQDLLEAAKVDGATESQTFWRVIIPQILPTIGVVVTTLIVLVMKVFDIVKVMTNGNFNTQVIANEMWQRAFTEANIGLGSALAVVLFIFVLPILYTNIRRMQEAAA